MRLNQVTVAVTEIGRAYEFYKGLGLLPVVGGLDHYARFVCPDGDATFSIHRAEAVPSPSATVVYFECEDLDGKVAELKGRGYLFEIEPVDQSWLWREAYLRDPDGNRICLFSAGENRLNPPWRLKDSD